MDPCHPSWFSSAQVSLAEGGTVSRVELPEAPLLENRGKTLKVKEGQLLQGHGQLGALRGSQ